MFLFKGKNLLNGVCMSVVAIFSNNNKLSEVLSSKTVNVSDFFSSGNASFSWISSTFDNNSSADSLYLFAYVWLSIVFFLVYLNVGLATLLFLLEAGLLSPIAAMSLLNALPLSSILFFLNAITMESVVGVIVVLSYSKDWAVRDFTKYEVLESNLSSAFLSKKKSYSWSETFIFTSLNCFWWLMLGLKYIKITANSYLISQLMLVLYKQPSPTYLLIGDIDKFGFPIYSVVPNELENVFFKLGSIFKQSGSYPNLFQKSPLIKKNFEFIGGGGLKYIEFFSHAEDLYNHELNLWKFHNFDFFKIMGTYTDSGLPIRISNMSSSKYLYTSNPNNLLSNLTMLSGLYFDETSIKKNSSFQNNFYKNTETLQTGSFNGTGMITNLNKNLSTQEAYNLLEHERRCLDIFKSGDFFLNENSLRGKKELNIFKFGNYSSLLNKGNGNYSSITSLGNSIENNLISTLQKYGSFDVAIKYISKNKLLSNINSAKITNNQPIHNIDYIKLKDYEFNKESSVALTVKSEEPVNQNRYFFNISKKLSFSNRVCLKFAKQKKYAIDSIRSNSPIKFKKIKIEKKINKKPRHLDLHINLKNISFFSNVKLTDQLISYTNQISNSFKYILGTSEWGSKNKISIFDLKSKNLPWFDYASEDEYFIDKSSGILFNSGYSWPEVKAFEKTNSSYKFINESKVNNYFSLENESKILKRRRRFTKSKIKTKKSKFYIKSGVKKTSLGSRLKQKKKIWNIRLNWNYNSSSESLYSFQNKNINSFFLENKTYVKRLGGVGSSLVVLEYRQISKFGTNNHNNFTVSVNSKQSQDFGIFEVNSGGDRFSTSTSNSSYKNRYPSFLNNRVFSFKESSVGVRNGSLSVIGKQLHKQKNDKLYSNGYGFANSANYLSSLRSGSGQTAKNLIMDKTEGYGGLPIYDSGGEFFKKLKIFWNNSSYGDLSYERYESKKIVDERFLSTFKKVIKNRSLKLTAGINRLEKMTINNKNILKILQNNTRMSILSKSFNKITESFDSETYNMFSGVDSKILLMEDREIEDSYVRSGYKKPHSVYGILWDEYLKHTYGFSINFMDLNNKINNDYNLGKKNLGILSIWNKRYDKNIESSLNVSNKQTGLTLDSNLANEITSRFLPKIGFYKSIDVDANLGFQKKFLLNKNKKYIKNLRIANTNTNFRDKKKIKKYFKKVILKNTVEKSSLSKKSINYIKKFSETPTGLKYDNINIGQKLPYIKKNITSINETVYTKYNAPETGSWLLPKNKSNDISNRLLTSKKSKIKTILGSEITFKKKNYQKLLLRLPNYSYKTFLDFKGKNKVKTVWVAPKNSKRVFLFYDKNISNYSVNNINENTKRSLEETKPVKNSEFLKRFEKMNSTTSNLFKKNRTKRFKNFNLMLRSNISNSHISGGSSFFNYTDFNKIDSDIFFKSIFSVRSNRDFDNYSIFESRPVKQIRSFENKNFYQINNNKKSNYSNYRNLNSLKSKVSEIWNSAGLLKNYKVDLNHFESTMNSTNYNNNLTSENYKIKNIDKRLILGFEDSYWGSVTNKKKINIFLTKTTKNSEFSEFYKSKDKFDDVGYIKNKKFSGLVDYTTSFSANFSSVIWPVSHNYKNLEIFFKKKNKYDRFFNRKAVWYIKEVFHTTISIKIHKDVAKFQNFPKIKMEKIISYPKLIEMASIKFVTTMPLTILVFYTMSLFLSRIILKQLVKLLLYLLKLILKTIVTLVVAIIDKKIIFKNKTRTKSDLFFK